MTTNTDTKIEDRGDQMVVLWRKDTLTEVQIDLLKNPAVVEDRLEQFLGDLAVKEARRIPVTLPKPTTLQPLQPNRPPTPPPTHPAKSPPPRPPPPPFQPRSHPRNHTSRPQYTTPRPPHQQYYKRPTYQQHRRPQH